MSPRTPPPEYPVTTLNRGRIDPLCPICDHLRQWGRRTGEPIHCRDCHDTWSGNNAQHCVICHQTFNSPTAADAHRFRRLPNGRNEDRCLAPALTPGWVEMRPRVWALGDEAS